MAPSKARIVSQAKANIMKALRMRRARSAPEPEISANSIASQSKPSVIKKNKKSSSADVTMPTGLHLLKRGCVTMHRIVRRKILGIKLTVLFNKKGEPYGSAAKEMQSYIGVLARTKAPIWRPTWKQVPRDRKNKIWQCVQMAFVVPSEARKMVLASAAQKWREFKSKLTTHYIIPYKDEPENLEYPPADYNFIEKAHWDIFVADRLSSEFMELHKIQKGKRSKNKYPHRLSRKGYANLEAELSESFPELELDRATMWIKARQDKHGNFKDVEVEQKAIQIDKLKQQVSDGEVTTCGTDDVLTKALGNPEHHGRVRGVGGSVKPSTYFNLPKHQRKTVEERIREGCKKLIEEEVDKQVAKERAFWADRLMRLEAKLEGGTVDTPTPHLSKEAGSGQGSCSKSAKKRAEDAGGSVKKRLELVDDLEEKECAGEFEIPMHEPAGGSEKLVNESTGGFEKLVHEKAGEIKKLVNKNAGEIKNQGHKKTEEVKILVYEPTTEADHMASPLLEVEQQEHNARECKLALGSINNIVAIASIVEVNIDCNKQTIHGAPLGEGNVRVSIVRPLVPEAMLPFPIKDEIMTVKDAVGTYIAWPRELIVQSSTLPKNQSKSGKGLKKRKRKAIGDDEDYYLDMKKLPENFPAKLKMLWLWAKDALGDGMTIAFNMEEKIFGIQRKAYLFKGDIYSLATMGELSGGTIIMYMCYLYEVLKKAKMVDMVGFVDPLQIGALGCGNLAEKSRNLADRFQNSKRGQIFLLPYNAGKHWMLTVVNPDEESIYFMDPLKRRLVGGEWHTIVENGIKIYNANRNRTGKKSIVWQNMSGIPAQEGDKDCGIFIMRYMKDIVEDKHLEFASKWQRRTDLVYTLNDLNLVRSEWATFVLKHHT